MAVKVTLAAALLVALLALTTATTFTTTVTTTTLDDDASRPDRQCRQQVQGRQFRACQQYLRQGRQADDDVLEMTTGHGGSAQECCRSLKEIERQQPQCGCEAIKQAVRQVQQGGQAGESQQIIQKASELPRVCNLRSQQCQFHVILV